MKKTILAALMASMSGFAMAQTSLYGSVHTYVEKRDGAGPSVTKLTSAPNSYIGFTGQEALGNGVLATFKLETLIRSDDPLTGNSQLGDNEATVGLLSNAGALRVGRAPHAVFLNYTQNEFGDKNTNASLSGLHNLRAARLSNAVFAEAKISKDFSIKFENGFSEIANKDNIYVVSANAALGPVTASATYYNGGDNNVTKMATARMPVSSSTTVGATYSHNQSTIGADVSTWQVGGEHKLTPAFAVSANYAKTDDKNHGYNLIGSYDLSKRTALRIKYRELEKTSGNEKLVALGIAHSF